MSVNMQRRSRIYGLKEVLSQAEYLCEMAKQGKIIKPIWYPEPNVRVKMKSARYKVFNRSTTCAGCGLQATHFALERHHAHASGGSWHFNLYARKPCGGEVLFTKDHIKARSKGGANNLSNYQTMCYKCNQNKADA